jgi:hypothetical protein
VIFEQIFMFNPSHAHLSPLTVPRFRIFGTVKFQGEINFGANITVLERPRIAACSNCDGVYSLEGLIAGTYTIQVTGLPLGTVITETITVGSGDVEHDFDGSLSFDSSGFTLTDCRPIRLPCWPVPRIDYRSLPGLDCLHAVAVRDCSRHVLI